MAPPVERPVRPRKQLRLLRVGNRATATLLRRLYGAGKSDQHVRERRSHKPTTVRNDFSNRNAAALSRRAHGEGETHQSVRARCAH